MIRAWLLTLGLSFSMLAPPACRGDGGAASEEDGVPDASGACDALSVGSTVDSGIAIFPEDPNRARFIERRALEGAGDALELELVAFPKEMAAISQHRYVPDPATGLYESGEIDAALPSIGVFRRPCPPAERGWASAHAELCEPFAAGRLALVEGDSNVEKSADPRYVSTATYTNLKFAEVIDTPLDGGGYASRRRANGRCIVIPTYTVMIPTAP